MNVNTFCHSLHLCNQPYVGYTLMVSGLLPFSVPTNDWITKYHNKLPFLVLMNLSNIRLHIIFTAIHPTWGILPI